jgi:hypothetical protein
LFNILYSSINTCSIDCTSIKDVKKKWQDLQSHTRRKEVVRKREAVKTGAGPKPPELKDEEEKVSHKMSIINNYCA